MTEAFSEQTCSRLSTQTNLETPGKCGVSPIRPPKPIGGVSSIPMLSGLKSGFITGLGSISSGLLQCYQTVSSHVVLPRLLGHEPVCSRPKRIEVLQRAYGHIGVCRTCHPGHCKHIQRPSMALKNGCMPTQAPIYEDTRGVGHLGGQSVGQKVKSVS